MALKLGVMDTALVLGALRIQYENVLARNLPEDKERLEAMNLLIDTFSRSFKAKLRVWR